MSTPIAEGKEEAPPKPAASQTPALDSTKDDVKKTTNSVADSAPAAANFQVVTAPASTSTPALTENTPKEMVASVSGITPSAPTTSAPIATEPAAVNDAPTPVAAAPATETKPAVEAIKETPPPVADSPAVATAPATAAAVALAPAIGLIVATPASNTAPTAPATATPVTTARTPSPTATAPAPVASAPAPEASKAEATATPAQGAPEKVEAASASTTAPATAPSTTEEKAPAASAEPPAVAPLTAASTDSAAAPTADASKPTGVPPSTEPAPAESTSTAMTTAAVTPAEEAPKETPPATTPTSATTPTRAPSGVKPAIQVMVPEPTMARDHGPATVAGTSVAATATPAAATTNSTGRRGVSQSLSQRRPPSTPAASSFDAYYLQSPACGPLPMGASPRASGMFDFGDIFDKSATSASTPAGGDDVALVPLVAGTAVTAPAEKGLTEEHENVPNPASVLKTDDQAAPTEALPALHDAAPPQVEPAPAATGSPLTETASTTTTTAPKIEIPKAPPLPAGQPATPVTASTEPGSPFPTPTGSSGVRPAPFAETSHLFVVRGDIRKIACDAWMIPADKNGFVTHYWKLDDFDVVVPDVPVAWMTREIMTLPCREWRPTGGQPWIANTSVDATMQLDYIVEGTRAFIAEASRFLKSNKHPPAFWRARYLLAVPLAGTGKSYGARFAGDVVQKVLPVILETAKEHEVDVCLVANKPDIYAAIQAWRVRARPAEVTWGVLTPAEMKQAQALADMARRGDLVLFLGAGVSAGCGLPVWKQLLTILAEKANLTPKEKEAMEKSPTFLDMARLLEGRMGAHGLSTSICDNLRTPYYSMTHALLATLPVTEAVTTNYDLLYEHACVGAGDATAVLPFYPDRHKSRWLCKMHGCVTRPESIVLTREEYMSYLENRGTLAGIVESLLLTKHMLFVGFSLTDENFHKIAREVRKSMKKRTPLGEDGTPVQTKRPMQHRKNIYLNDPNDARAWDDDSMSPIGSGTGPAAPSPAPPAPVRITPADLASGAKAKFRKAPKASGGEGASGSGVGTPSSTASDVTPLTRTGTSMVAAASKSFGTSLALQADDMLAELWAGDISVVALGPSDAPIGEMARRLQIFLDYLLVRATTFTSFLMDPRFMPLLGDREQILVGQINTFLESLPTRLTNIPAWRPMAEWLRRLGSNNPLPPSRAAFAPASPDTAVVTPAFPHAGPGHVFIVQGDLRRLQCDHWLVPSSRGLYIPAWWMFGAVNMDNGRPSASSSVSMRKVEVEGHSTCWAVDVDCQTVKALMDVVWAFLSTVAEETRQAPPRNGRARHLVALPVVGTGFSGRAGKSAEILGGLMPLLHKATVAFGYDVVLVVYDHTAYNAAQVGRRRFYDPRTALNAFPKMQEAATRMAQATRQGSLIIIAGSDLAAGARVPSMAEIMMEYASTALAMPPHELASLRRMQLSDRATIISRRDGGLDKLRKFIDGRINEKYFSLRHCQFSNLSAKTFITTCADKIMENCMQSISRPVYVLPYDDVNSDRSSILKICGDPRALSDIPLSKRDLDVHLDRHTANLGMVHALLTTKDTVVCGMDMENEADARFMHTIKSNMHTDTSTETLLLVQEQDSLFADIWRPQFDVFSMGEAAQDVSLREELEKEREKEREKEKKKEKNAQKAKNKEKGKEAESRDREGRAEGAGAGAAAPASPATPHTPTSARPAPRVSLAEMRRREEILFDTVLGEVAAESFAYLLDKRYQGYASPEDVERFLSADEIELSQRLESFVSCLPPEVYRLPAHRLLKNVISSLGGVFYSHGGYALMEAQARMGYLTTDRIFPEE